MDEQLLEIVVERLAGAGLPPVVEDLVIGACEGQQELSAALTGTSPPRPEPRHDDAAEEPVGAYLTKLTVEGFRGVGPPTTLSVAPGPGLTIVAGRNGSGKSSLAEAFELLLTGENRRWEGRKTKLWQEGWRNLHHSQPTRIEAELAVEGAPGVTRVSRSWAEDAELHDDDVWVQVAGAPRGPLDSLGWSGVLATFRPFLSYNELGSMLEEGPAALYDTLSLVLGLEELTAAETLLSRTRLDDDKARKAITSRAKDLRARLASLDDPRAEQCADALDAKPWDLDVIDRALADSGEGDDASDLSLLRQLASLMVPDADAASATADNLRLASGRAATVADTDAGRARDLVALLKTALDHHGRHGDGDCPVCGGGAALTDAWRARTEDHVARLSAAAREADEAHRELQGAREAARRFVPPVPAALADAGRLGIDAGTATGAWTAAVALPAGDDDAMAAHLEQTVPPLSAAVSAVRAAAEAEVERRNDAWRPIAKELAAWSLDARPIRDSADRAKYVKAAEEWIKLAAVDIRSERFVPIAEKAQSIWSLLRQQSNVDLERVELEGTKTRRRVNLGVTVDGVEGVALGVMSQGELHALALSLFLPRATLPESPFRFLVLDDPVQAMDPARVDGLAKVLEEIAKRRQVIVLTHDDRLPEAVRRMAIPARVIEVTRKQGSVVELRESSTPAHRALEDAFAVAKTQELPAVAAGRVVPGLCRLAVEAACNEVVRRRRIGRGEPHDEVEQLLSDLKLAPRLALALFDDEGRAGDVPQTIENKFGRSKKDAYFRLNKGVHQGEAGDLLGLVRNCEQLLDGVLALP